jgi:hypothetical protein
MIDFALSQIFYLLSERGIARSEKTFGKWKRIIQLPLWSTECNRVQAEWLVGVALMRCANPTKPLALKDVVKFSAANRNRIEQVLAGVPRLKPKLEGEFSWQKTARLIAEHSACGIQPSDDTLARWCGKLGINFSRVMPMSASIVYRLIDQADREAEARVLRGRRLGQQRKMKQVQTQEAA